MAMQFSTESSTHTSAAGKCRCQLRGSTVGHPGHPKAHVADAQPWLAAGAAGRTKKSWMAEPGTTANHLLPTSAVFPQRAVRRRAVIGIVPAIGDPIVSIPVDLIEPPLIEGEALYRNCAPIPLPSRRGSVLVGAIIVCQCCGD